MQTNWVRRIVALLAICATASGNIGAAHMANADSGASAALDAPSACAGLPAATVRTVDANGTTSTEPPAGFDPLTASDTALRCYGFPARPQNPAALEGWQQAMTHAARYVLPALAQTSIRPGSVVAYHDTYYSPPPYGDDYPWSGYAVSAYHNTQWSNLQWNYAVGQWIVPHGNPYCFGGGAASWVAGWAGVGGDGWDGGTSYVIQDGTITFDGYPTTPVYFWWLDYYPNGPGLTELNNLAVSPGNDVYTNLTYEGNDRTYFYFENLSTNSYSSVTATTPYVDLTSAEFINEDQPSNWDYVNFGTIPFQGAYMSGTWGNNYPIGKFLSDDVNLSQFTSYKSANFVPSNEVAWPTSVDSQGNFTVYSTQNDEC